MQAYLMATSSDGEPGVVVKRVLNLHFISCDGKSLDIVVLEVIQIMQEFQD